MNVEYPILLFIAQNSLLPRKNQLLATSHELLALIS